MGRRLRVLVDPPALQDELEVALERWVVPADDTDEIGFLVQPGVERSTLTVILDRGGVFLTRQRKQVDAVRDLTELIGSLEPPHEGATGLSVRAVATGEELAVGSMAGLRTISNASRDIDRHGGRLLPSLRTWVGADGLELGTGRRLRRLVLPVDPLHTSPTWGQGVAALAATVVSNADEQHTLDLAAGLVDSLDLVGATSDKAADLARAFVIER